MASQYIRIVAIPPGEAPLWVREKWVGLCLPVADSRGQRNAYVSGVLSGPHNRVLAFVWRFLGKLGKQSGYAVYLSDAIDELEKTAPDAATWWRQNVPRLQSPGSKLLFRTSYCQLVKPECTPDIRSVFPTLRQNLATPQFGLSTVPQIPVRPTPARNLPLLSPVTPAILLTLVLVGWFWNWSHPTQPERQTQVHGNLVEWSLHTYSSRGGSHQTVHLRITGYREEFRIDPGIFHDLMGNRLPAGFTKGAAIDITADATQLAAPLHPVLNPGVAIVWVNGLIVNGATAFSLRDILQHERGQWTGWLALAAMVAVFLGYAILNSRKRLRTT